MGDSQQDELEDALSRASVAGDVAAVDEVMRIFDECGDAAQEWYALWRYANRPGTWFRESEVDWRDLPLPPQDDRPARHTASAARTNEPVAGRDTQDDQIGTPTPDKAKAHLRRLLDTWAEIDEDAVSYVGVFRRTGAGLDRGEQVVSGVAEGT